MITIKSKGSFKNTEGFINKILKRDLYSRLNAYGREGVEALSSATPLNSGLTASSWYYEIIKSSNFVTIRWLNSNIVDGIPVVILLQYGHGTGTGGYVQGYDFINPAIKPIFDKIANSVWKEVTSA